MSDNKWCSYCNFIIQIISDGITCKSGITCPFYGSRIGYISAPADKILHVWELVICTVHTDRYSYKCSCGIWSGCMIEETTRMVAENHAYPNQERKQENVRR